MKLNELKPVAGARHYKKRECQCYGTADLCNGEDEIFCCLM